MHRVIASGMCVDDISLGVNTIRSLKLVSRVASRRTHPLLEGQLSMSSTARHNHSRLR